jgi:hypothetical protein
MNEERFMPKKLQRKMVRTISVEENETEVV